MKKTTFPSERRFDLDWLRLLAIVILLFYHTGMLFNPWPWHIKNGETSEHFRYWMMILHYWRMPLLLFISGAGTYMALGKRTPKQFVSERFKRLFIPLLFGMFVVVPPQIYYEHIGSYSSYWDFYKTVFEFVPYPNGSFSWHHLWFVAYLLIFSLLALPLLIFLRSPRSGNVKAKFKTILSGSAGLLFIPSAFILLTQILLRPFFPQETHDLIHDWAFFAYYMSFFLLGMICYSNADLWERIGENRKQLLLASVLILIPFYGLYAGARGFFSIPWDMELSGTAFDVTAIFLSWFWVITAISFGQHYLNQPHPWLGIVNEGLYPFYILHQTVIIVIGYYVCKLPWSIALKFWSVSLLTFIVSTGFYIFCIRPFDPVRILFGVKPALKKTARPN